MLVPKNQEALLVEKLKRDNETMKEQIDGFQKSIESNVATIDVLTQLGVWEDVETPPQVNPASRPLSWDADQVLPTKLEPDVVV